MLRRIWDELGSGKNVDAYVGIVVAVIVLLLDLFGLVSPNVVEKVLLLLLSLIAFGRIADRWFIEDLRDKLLQPEFTVWEDFKNDVTNRLRNAKRLRVLGVAPLGFVREHKEQLLDICGRGDICICFVDPNSTAMTLICHQRPEQKYDAEALITEIGQLRITLGANAKRLEVRLFNYVPPYVITVIDDNKEEAVFATVNNVKKVGSQRMTLSATNRNSRLLSYFTDEFEALWNMGQAYLESRL